MQNRWDRLCPPYTDVPTKFLKRQAHLISSFARRLCETNDSQSTERERVKLDYALDPLSIKTATTTTLMSLLDFATKLARFLAYLLPLATVGFIEF